MSSVRIVYRFLGGAEIEAAAWADNSYPEALATARENAITAFREAWLLLEDDGEITELFPAEVADDDG